MLRPRQSRGRAFVVQAVIFEFPAYGIKLANTQPRLAFKKLIAPEKIMLKKYLSLVLLALLMNVFIANSAQARAQNNNQTQPVEKIKIKVAKLGVGEKARATVHLKDGTKVRCYITQVSDNDFAVRDRKTNEPRTISYQDVAKVDNNKGHSSRNIFLGIGIGAGATLGILALIIVNSLN